MSKPYTLRRPAASTPHIAYEKELNPEQLQVVTSGDGPTLVLAGPGSGKTRTLTYRVSYLLERQVAPERILLVTFTVKAAREMLERVERILKFRPEGLWGGTFHHIGNLILRRHAESIQRSATFGILDEEDAKHLIAACIGELKIPTTKNRFPQASVLETLLSLSVNTCRPFEEIVLERSPQFSEQLGSMERVVRAYQERKRQANLMDYDDLLTAWRTLLTEHKELRKRYCEQFQYILVDEYQDTNRLQFELVQALASGHGNILAVGDDAQAIYAFRGAEVKNLRNFPEVFPGTTLYRLETNYRSTPEILRLANASMEFNTQQFPKKLKSVQEPGVLPAVVPLMNVKQQASFVAQRALELREEGVPLQAMAVLFRARFQAAELELELAKRNIPYIVRGGVRFFEQAHIKDVLAYLRIQINPHDELAWERILRLQEGIGTALARRIWERLAQTPNPFQTALSGLQTALSGREGKPLPLPSRAQTAWKQLCQTLRQLNPKTHDPQPAQMILTILHASYTAYLQAHFENARDRREDLEQLMNLAAHYKTVDRFIEDISLREPFKGETIGGWEQPDEFLVLSTIHQAKGLEWEAVFLIGLAEGQFPHPKSVDDSEALEEERRLFYVAVTRTKRHLHLTYPLSRYSYQRGEILMRPSQFIQELPETSFELWRVGEEFASADEAWPLED